MHHKAKSENKNTAE